VHLLDDQPYTVNQLVGFSILARVDAMFIAGNIYDRMACPAEAAQLLNEVVARLILDLYILVVIGASYDSPDRLTSAFPSGAPGSDCMSSSY
jgi:DNA repair protein SbcD/Mre11